VIHGHKRQKSQELTNPPPEGFFVLAVDVTNNNEEISMGFEVRFEVVRQDVVVDETMSLCSCNGGKNCDCGGN
jgi:hypothetical protein